MNSTTSFTSILPTFLRNNSSENESLASIITITDDPLEFFEVFEPGEDRGVEKTEGLKGWGKGKRTGSLIFEFQTIHFGHFHEKLETTSQNLKSYIFSDHLSTLSLLFTFIMIVMCISGAIMNTLSLIIFTSRSFRKRSINVLLAGLSTSDLCLLLLAVPVFSLNQIQKVIPGKHF